MKKLVALLIASAFVMPVLAEEAKPETKKVCVTQKDAKTGKDKEVCKNVKIHKKHDGTKPEDVKKADPKKK
jgi:Ni/Co efflux regulator RcnB